MGKALLSDETKNVLADLSNRINQLIEVNQLYLTDDKDRRTLIESQEKAFHSVLYLIDQITQTGQIYRGNDFVPDAVEPLATTKWQSQTKLI